jgi:acyl-CoA thioester hydrolase
MSKKSAFPTLPEVTKLPQDVHLVVPPEWEDRNGHVNVQYYLRLYELGGWRILERAGFDEDWFNRCNISFFDLENHLRYLAEINVGDTVSGYSRLVGVSDKRLHGMYLIVNETQSRLAAVIEYVTAMIDMRVRRTAAFPEELSDGLGALLARHRKLSWPAPSNGFMKP